MSDTLTVLIYATGAISVFCIIIAICNRFDTVHLKRKVKKVERSQATIKRLFGNHFTITDQTILDTRQERDFWKKKALSFEKRFKKR